MSDFREVSADVLSADESERVAGLCLAEMRSRGAGHDAGEERYWVASRGWSWLHLISRAIRQCEVEAVYGDRYLCRVAGRAGAVLPPDDACPACQQRELDRRFPLMHGVNPRPYMATGWRETADGRVELVEER